MHISSVHIRTLLCYSWRVPKLRLWATAKTCTVEYVSRLNRDPVTTLLSMPGASYWHVYTEAERNWLMFPPLLLCFLFLLELPSLRSVAPERARPRLCADLSLAAFHNDELLLRRGPGKHDLRVVLQNVIQLLGSHVLQITSMYHAGLGIPTIRTERQVTRHFTSTVLTPKKACCHTTQNTS